MPALVQRCHLVDISYHFDGVTFYPKTLLDISTLLEECSQLDFLEIDRIKQFKPKEERKKIQKEICTEEYGFVGFVFSDDDDHGFYHQDELDVNKTHYHIKFKSMRTERDLEKILTIFVACHCLSEKEKQTFLEKLHARYAESRQHVEAQLEGNQAEDYKKIIAFIMTCADNDILIYLHNHLLTPAYDYLRAVPESQQSIWQGLNQAQKIMGTSEAWAMIEKSFAFQLGQNIKRHAHLSAPFSASCAENYAQHYRFFSMKRKHGRGDESKLYKAFHAGDQPSFDERYTKHVERLKFK